METLKSIHTDEKTFKQTNRVSNIPLKLVEKVLTGLKIEGIDDTFVPFTEGNVDANNNATILVAKLNKGRGKIAYRITIEEVNK